MTTGIRLVRKSLELDRFTQIPGAYQIRGPFTQIVAVEESKDSGKVEILLIQDLSIEERFKVSHAKWVEAAAKWDDINQGLKEDKRLGWGRPEEPEMTGVKIVIMKEGDDQEPMPPGFDPGSLVYLGKVVTRKSKFKHVINPTVLHILTPAKSDSVGGLLGGLFGF